MAERFFEIWNAQLLICSQNSTKSRADMRKMLSSCFAARSLTLMTGPQARGRSTCTKKRERQVRNCIDNPGSKPAPEIEDYLDTRGRLLAERRFGVTGTGYMRLVRIQADPGDAVCAFQGCPASFALRRRDEAYVLGGNAYIREPSHKGEVYVEDVLLW